MTQLNPSELRPFGAGEAIDVAGNVFRAHFRQLMLRSATVVVPVTALRWADQMADLHPAATALVRTYAGQSDAVDFFAASRFMFTGVAERHMLLSISVFIATIMLGTVWCVRPALAAIAGPGRIRPWKFNVLTLLTGALRIAILVVLALSGVFLALTWIFGLFLLGRWGLLPGITAGEAPRENAGTRARALASGQEFRIGFRIGLGFVLASAFVSAIGLIGMGLFTVGALNVPESLVTVSMVMSALSTTFVCAFLGSLLATVYLEQRTRTEGFDIALMIQEIPNRSVVS